MAGRKPFPFSAAAEAEMRRLWRQIGPTDERETSPSYRSIARALARTRGPDGHPLVPRRPDPAIVRRHLQRLGEVVPPRGSR